MRSPSLRKSAPRCVALSFGQSPSVNALCAARTARSTSSAPPRGINAHGFPAYGLSVSKVWPEAASVHSPPMNILYFVNDAVAVSMVNSFQLSCAAGTPGIAREQLPRLLAMTYPLSLRGTVVTKQSRESPRSSHRLRAGRFDDLAPAVIFDADQLRESIGRAPDEHGA